MCRSGFWTHWTSDYSPKFALNETFDGVPMFLPGGEQLVFASNRDAVSEGDTNLFIADGVD